MKYLLITIFTFFINISLSAEISHENFDKLFNVGTMKSYDNEFTETPSSSSVDNISTDSDFYNAVYLAIFNEK